MKRLAFGTLRLRPDEFWGLTQGELLEWAEAVSEDERRRAEDRYFLAAWQTAHLMNATGNFKKPVTPSKLLGRAEGNAQEVKFESREAKLRALAELQMKFE